MDIHVDPPRHTVTYGIPLGTDPICYRTILTEDCPLSHNYGHHPITRDEEAQLEWIRAQASKPNLEAAFVDRPVGQLIDQARASAGNTLWFYQRYALDPQYREDVLEKLREPKERAANLGQAIGSALVARDSLSVVIDKLVEEGRTSLNTTSQEG